MRGFGMMVALFASSGCDRVFQLDTIRDEASADANGDVAANAITVTFGETGDATYSNVTADTYLDSQAPTFNYGIDSLVVFDGGTSPSVGLIRFDVSRLPAQAQIVSASIRLTTGGDQSFDPTVAVRMLEVWDEGALAGVAGAPSWNEASVGRSWSAPGAAPPSRDTKNLGSFIPSAYDAPYELALEPTVVASWVAEPDQNFGLALVTESNDGAAVRSSEASTPSLRPLLTVVFVPP